MFSVVCLCIGIVFGAVAVIAGYRLGRNGSASGAGGQTNQPASSGVTLDAATVAATQQAVARTEQYNRETAEILQKMRDIIERNSGVAGNGTSDTNDKD